MMSDEEGQGVEVEGESSTVTATEKCRDTSTNVKTRAPSVVSGSGGYRRLKNQSKLFKKCSWDDRMSRGADCAVADLGEQASLEMKEDFQGCSKEEGDGIIRSLLSQGLYHVKIRALFGVGGITE
jgi:hypothetical protein